MTTKSMQQATIRLDLYRRTRPEAVQASSQPIIYKAACGWMHQRPQW